MKEEWKKCRYCKHKHPTLKNEFEWDEEQAYCNKDKSLNDRMIIKDNIINLQDVCDDFELGISINLVREKEEK